MLGEMLCAGINVMGFDWIASPACTELEVVTLDWLAQLLNLPACFRHSTAGPGGGVIQGSAGESAIVALLVAVRRAQEHDSGLCREKMVVICSDQAHAIITKACMVLGIQCHTVITDPLDNLRLRGSAVADAVQLTRENGQVPVAVVATTGTTSSCTFDPIPEIAAVSKEHNLWLHIDAAYGGAYACLPEMAPFFQGLDQATLPLITP